MPGRILETSLNRHKNRFAIKLYGTVYIRVQYTEHIFQYGIMMKLCKWETQTRLTLSTHASLAHTAPFARKTRPAAQTHS